MSLSCFVRILSGPGLCLGPPFCTCIFIFPLSHTWQNKLTSLDPATSAWQGFTHFISTLLTPFLFHSQPLNPNHLPLFISFCLACPCLSTWTLSEVPFSLSPALAQEIRAQLKGNFKLDLYSTFWSVSTTGLIVTSHTTGWCPRCILLHPCSLHTSLQRLHPS